MSALTWLDFSADEQRRTREILRLFEETESRDELGIGQVRDAFSDLLFPGTSVLLTRARYFLIVPWCAQHADSTAHRKYPLTMDAVERQALVALKASATDELGIIGARAGAAVKNLPSVIYANALERYGIARDPVEFVPDEELGEQVTRQALGKWVSSLPPAPAGFPNTIDSGVQLSQDEAAWLSEQITSSCPDSYLTHLLLSDLSVDGVDWPWAHPGSQPRTQTCDRSCTTPSCSPLRCTDPRCSTTCSSQSGTSGSSSPGLPIPWRVIGKRWTTGSRRWSLTRGAPHGTPARCGSASCSRTRGSAPTSGPDASSPTGSTCSSAATSTASRTTRRSASWSASASEPSRGRNHDCATRSCCGTGQAPQEASASPIGGGTSPRSSATSTRAWRCPVLEPDGRALLLDALRAPEGYHLDHGVATTFTLHLDTALSVPLSFLPRRLAESGDPIAVMEAVRSAADRLDVFHQAGMVSMPPSRSPIFSFLEPVLHAVRRPKAGHLFHAKLWVLRYRNEEDGDVRMRLLVPSRNLTADRSWDLCLQLDGWPGARPSKQNKPVVDLVRALPGLSLAPLLPERLARLEHLADDLHRTEWELPENVDELSFDVLGLGKRLPDDFFVGDNHVVISPFCTDAGLATVTGGRPATVISRQESLDALQATTLRRHRAFVLDPLTSEVEDVGEGAALTATGLTGLHAKCYVLTYNRRAWIRVGSANATEAAFGGNVEVLVSLVGSASKLGVAALTAEDGALRSILAEHSPQAPAEDDDTAQRLDHLLIDLASQPFTATVQPDGERYLVDLQGPVLSTAPEGTRLTVALVTVPELAVAVPIGQPIRATFNPLKIDDICGFVVITATAGDMTASAVVLAELIGAPADRLDEIVARQVDTPENFLRFLALLLGMGQPAWALGAGQQGAGQTATGSSFEAPGLLELLMRALVEHPDRLDDLARLVDKLRDGRSGAAVLPPGFTEIWDVVDAVRQEEENVASPVLTPALCSPGSRTSSATPWSMSQDGSSAKTDRRGASSSLTRRASARAWLPAGSSRRPWSTCRTTRPLTA